MDNFEDVPWWYPQNGDPEMWKRCCCGGKVAAAAGSEGEWKRRGGEVRESRGGPVGDASLPDVSGESLGEGAVGGSGCVWPDPVECMQGCGRVGVGGRCCMTLRLFLRHLAREPFWSGSEGCSHPRRESMTVTACRGARKYVGNGIRQGLDRHGAARLPRRCLTTTTCASPHGAHRFARRVGGRRCSHRADWTHGRTL